MSRTWSVHGAWFLAGMTCAHWPKPLSDGRWGWEGAGILIFTKLEKVM